MSTKIQILFLSTLAFVSFETLAQSSWELDKNQDSIKVYTKVEKGSEFKAFKAVALFNASTDEITKIIKNVDRYSEWYGYTKTAQLLKQEKDVQYNYVETIFPWPFRNRDMIYRMSINGANREKIEISIIGIPDYAPDKKGVVRMKKAEGYILLEPIGNKTEVTYVFHCEPGKNVPPWLANNSIAELPYQTLVGLRAILKEGVKTSR